MNKTTRVVKLPNISLSNVLLLLEKTQKKRRLLEKLVEDLVKTEEKLLLYKDKVLIREHNKVTNSVVEESFKETPKRFPLLPGTCGLVEFEKVYEMNIFQQTKLKVKGQATYIKFLDVGDNEHVMAVFAQQLSHGKITQKTQVVAHKWSSDVFSLKLTQASEWSEKFTAARDGTSSKKKVADEVFSGLDV